ncbi:hypothetical protein B0O80DRAFT_447069 [Mortierella sp. GBAus27b]|nr:hypothetical protein B0O80DRAFT_447069 [Mortierella sp. GBAus27b]
MKTREARMVRKQWETSMEHNEKDKFQAPAKGHTKSTSQMTHPKHQPKDTQSTSQKDTPKAPAKRTHSKHQLKGHIPSTSFITYLWSEGPETEATSPP